MLSFSVLDSKTERRAILGYASRIEAYMTPLELIRLTPLTDRTSGRPDVIIGLIDGPVAINHPELASQHIREIAGNGSGYPGLIAKTIDNTFA